LAIERSAAGAANWSSRVALTKAVVAICVVFVPFAGVGAVGVPVKAGEAIGAREVSVGWT
jgi:hypothetical protein